MMRFLFAVLLVGLVSGCAATRPKPTAPRIDAPLHLGDSFIGAENGHRYRIARYRCPGSECAYVLTHNTADCPRCKP